MTPHTQTSLHPGNCWQTAVACVLDVDPAQLPDQLYWENPKREHGWRCSYKNVLNGYLSKHHGIRYASIEEMLFVGIASLKVSDGYHVMCGPTVRTPENGANHCVVGRNGAFIWDPHPSRAGLVKVETWGVLCPILPAHRAFDETRTDEDYLETLVRCLCFSCIDARGKRAYYDALDGT